MDKTTIKQIVSDTVNYIVHQPVLTTKYKQATTKVSRMFITPAVWDSFTLALYLV